MTSAQGQNLPALVTGSRKCQRAGTRLCFQCCLRPSSLVGPRIPVLCGALLLPARGILSGLWVVAPPWSWAEAKGRAHGAQPGVDGYGMCVQVFPVPVRDTSYPSKEEPNHRLLLLQVAEGTKQVLRGRQPICKYPVSFPAYYAM